MTFLILTFIFVFVAKKLKFFAKQNPEFSQKYDIRILVKNTTFPSSFSIVA